MLKKITSFHFFFPKAFSLGDCTENALACWFHLNQ